MLRNDSINFILVGVGGQGTLLASELLAQVGMEAGYDVKQAEVHGMAQRGGSVSSHVRWGTEVYSPLIAAGEADVLVAFEQVEAVRFAHLVRPGGVILVNQQAILPITVSAGSAVYPSPEYLHTALSQISKNVYWIPALDIAAALGNDKVANLVMLGALSALVDIPAATWLKVMESRVPARYLQLNQLAFQHGRNALEAEFSAETRSDPPRSGQWAPTVASSEEGS